MLSVFLSLAVALSAFGSPQTPAESEIARVAQSKYWQKLMHYKHSFPFGKIKSQLDGPGFFFAPDGKTNPEGELRATIAAFSKDIEVGRLKQHPQCAFPERYRYLKRELHLAVRDVPCPQLDEFLSRFNDPRSVTLVFSSAYPNNPGSMFGHTFLRINAAGDKKKSDLLDQGLSFAAVVGDDENGLAFVFLGLTGGYMGQFSLMPYYAKVNEYINSESRDIWEYDLSLSPAETRTLLLHAWEIETNSWFDYFFLDENCAYQLLALLEVAKPEWDGLTDFAIYVIPGETVKRVARIPGAVRGIKFRPSLRKKMLRRVYALSGAERDQFFSVIDGKTDLSQAHDPAVLESAMSYLYYVKQRDGGKLSKKQAEALRMALLRRAELGGEGQPVPSTEVVSLPLSSRLSDELQDTRPDLAHNTYRLGTSSGVAKTVYFQELSFKFAFHDLLNDDTGYIRFSQVDFPGITLRYSPSPGTLNVEDVAGLSLWSLFPLTFVEKRPSWRLNTEYYSPKDFGCTTCHVGRAEGGLGATVEVFSPEVVASSFVLGNFEVGNALHKGFRGGPKLESMLLAHPFSRYKLQLVQELVTDLGQSDRQKVFHQFECNQSYSLSQWWDIRTAFMYILPTSDVGHAYNEAKLTLNYYF